MFKGESRLWLRQKSADDININIYYDIYVNVLKYNIIVVISNCIITFNYALYYMNIKPRDNFRYLVATVVGARGIDIDNVTLVINYERSNGKREKIEDHIYSRPRPSTV